MFCCFTSIKALATKINFFLVVVQIINLANYKVKLIKLNHLMIIGRIKMLKQI